MNNITLALFLTFFTLKASAFDLNKVAVPSSFLNKPYVVVDVIDARTTTYIGERHDYGFDSVMYTPSGSLKSLKFRKVKKLLC